MPGDHPMDRVLLVEDDDDVRGAVGLVLRAAGLDVIEACDGRAALEVFSAEGADVVVLDLMMPGVDGFTVCEELRSRSQVPIVIMTSRDDPADVVRGLELGADDYVVKPFETAILLARIRAALRRGASTDPEVLEAGNVRLDVSAWRAWRGAKELELTATEMRLLDALLRNRGNVMTRDVLLDRVWGYDYLGDSRLVDMAVRRLRTKLDDEQAGESLIATVRGVGYRFDG